MRWKRRAFVRQPLVQLAVLLLAIHAGSQWFQSSLRARVGEKAAALAGPGDVLMFSSENCAHCVLAQRWLTEHQVAFEQCVIEHDTACAEGYRALAAPGTPTLLVRGERQVGFDPQRLLGALERKAASPS